ncbi:MAG: hypothetical protein A3C85_03065 [Candidatus Doudnabacteria bacterium RIFCSPHIGHO2_02_FULL_48_21]|uniref:Uncharacterized protein n=1 Tax=Candidatus Doudnabacteria bacterium RIFCSPLOWO2_02_FULL_48_13 TaxID=1817845 RepID=A0A1F5QBY4_9BACT|nr:MAG: hypothetical protein A3K05_00325 [Candidatus Doudnabacteria bacterium RIFCSPHIGHO2_01_48_18]OGE77085.1 MAG: hypothetical protein A2668_02435 [Candidatus Doudnabacteria bacterium RIFCSPHIGHO2_01_FULL_48_180]OGE91626.1 MAG: hypothetical protein A3F44_02895 [Candidatus Doudnabacteria bacterium RIFCSPHIGHO2_12_FULL_47_25]OGE93240.1 MAG: hypothetical protein A3C85_03065 [Candidatus Doudnabacteria bacterium RIFCSPHIGHO2_02_FULL_48_21]OGE96363.1 MAG: hypothetical protein A3A83_01310 [Candidatu
MPRSEREAFYYRGSVHQQQRLKAVFCFAGDFDAWPQLCYIKNNIFGFERKSKLHKAKEKI